MRNGGLCIGIDASNLRGGGGLTHLKQLLREASPEQDGFGRLVVWGGRNTLEQLPADRAWLTLAHEPALDGGLAQRTLWRYRRLKGLAGGCDLLFLPGGLPGPGPGPWVTMSRNMLPFDPVERRRYGLSAGRLRLEVLKRAQASSFGKASGVIFLSEFARKSVLRELPREPHLLDVIAHGVDDRFRMAPRPARRIEQCGPDAPFRFLYVSTVNLYKHQWNVAAAVSVLRNSGLPVALDLIGGGYEPALGKLKKVLDELDPGSEFIRYHGSVPFEQLHERYHTADAFVYASTCENMPNILLESMAAGLPIASSDYGPMPEVLGEGGLYFDAEDSGAIADALRRMAGDAELRARLAKTAYERALRYSWRNCTRKTFAFLNRAHTRHVGKAV